MVAEVEETEAGQAAVGKVVAVAAAAAAQAFAADVGAASVLQTTGTTARVEYWQDCDDRLSHQCSCMASLHTQMIS